MSQYKEVEDYSPAFRVQFANVAEPNTFDPAKPVYDIRGLFPKTMDMSWFTNKLTECAQMNALLGPDGNPIVPAPVIGDGDAVNCFSKPTAENPTPEQYDGHLQHWWLKFRSGNKKSPSEGVSGEPIPFGIVGIDGKTPVEPGEVYNGMWMRACYKLFPFNHPKFGLKIIMRCEHLQVLGHDTPFKGGGSFVDTATKFATAAPVVGLPAGVGSAPAPVASGVVPQAAIPITGNVVAPIAPPQAVTMAPGEYQQAVSAPTAPAPAAPPQQGMSMQPASPGGAAMPAPVAAAPVVMGPNAQGHTYEAWQATGQTDDQLRAAGVIL